MEEEKKTREDFDIPDLPEPEFNTVTNYSLLGAIVDSLVKEEKKGYTIITVD